MPISPPSRLPATPTHSWSRSAWPSRPLSSPTSSTASTTPRSTFPQSHEATAHDHAIEKDYDHDHDCQHLSQSASSRAQQVRPARGGSRLSGCPRLDGDYVPLLRLPEVVSVRIRKT